jgi:hypothetical protein
MNSFHACRSVVEQDGSGWSEPHLCFQDVFVMCASTLVVLLRGLIDMVPSTVRER